MAALGYEQAVPEERVIKILLEVIVKKYRRRKSCGTHRIRMSDLRDEIVSLNNSIASQEVSLINRSTSEKRTPQKNIPIEIELQLPLDESMENASTELPGKQAIEIDPDTSIDDNSKYENSYASIQNDDDSQILENSLYSTCVEYQENSVKQQPEDIPKHKPPQTLSSPIIEDEPQIPQGTLNRHKNNMISQIIHELVLKKYEDTLNMFRQRSLKRRKKLSEAEEIHYSEADNKDDAKNRIVKREDSIDSGLNCSTEDFLQRNSTVSEDEVERASSKNSVVSFFKQLDTENEETDFNENVSQINDADNVVEYDEAKFLQDALGDELLNVSVDSKNISRLPPINQISPQPRFSIGESIGSSNISTLISCSEGSNAIDSLYSTIDKKMKKKNRKKNSNGSVVKCLFENKKSDFDYESILEYKTSSIEDELITQNSAQREIIYQISKALEVCKSRPEYFSEEVLLEAEKILLIATCKKEVLSKEITKIEYEDVDHEHATVSLHMKNVQFQVDYETYTKKHGKGTWYFVCIADAGSVVLASDAITHNDRGKVVFEDGFKFEKLSSDVEINVSVYAIHLTKQEKKKALCRSFNSLSKRRHEKSTNTSTQSSFLLLGRTTLTNSSLQSKTFKLSKMPHEAIITDCFTADCDVFIKLNILKSGFLTVGTTYRGVPIWNRRWCVLDGSRLKYWNYPIETDQEPVGSVDMLTCINQLAMKAERNLCSRPRTLYLQFTIGEEQVVIKELFLSADSVADMEVWQRNLNIVLNTIARWNNFNCYLVN